MQSVTELNDAKALARQRHEWAIQHGGWVVMALVVLLGASGLLGGGGPLDRRTAGDEGDSIWVEYPRAARVETPSTFRVHLLGELPEGEVSFWIVADYLDHVAVSGISPEPESVRADGDRVTYTFDATADRPVAIDVTVQPDDPGLLRSALGRVEGPALLVTQMVMP